MTQKDKIISKYEDTEDKFLQALLLKSAKIQKNLIDIKEYSINNAKEYSTNNTKDNNNNKNDKDNEDNEDDKDEDNEDNEDNNKEVNQVKYL